MIARIREADPELYAEMAKNGRRNIAMLTIAPTGTTSLMSQTTSGIEPVFRPVYKRRRKVNPIGPGRAGRLTWTKRAKSFRSTMSSTTNFVKWLDANGYDTAKLETISGRRAERSGWPASPYHRRHGQRHRLGERR